MTDSAPQIDPSLISAVKGFEGFTPKAQWDYKQHSNGYGTKATSPNETIDPATADQRLTSELGNAQAQVDGFSPNLPPGVRNALSSLTFNAGSGWMNSGLGSAIKAGDMDKAQSLFLAYNKAGGQENPSLTARRQQEASWFNSDATAPPSGQSGAPPAAPSSPPGSPGMASPQLGMLAGQLPQDPSAGQQQDPNLALLQQHAQAMTQQDTEPPPPMQPIAMPMPRGQLAARLRAAALGRGLTGGI